MLVVVMPASGRSSLNEGNEGREEQGDSKKCKITKEIREAKRVRDLELRRNVPLPPLLYLCLDLCSENH